MAKAVLARFDQHGALPQGPNVVGGEEWILQVEQADGYVLREALDEVGRLDCSGGWPGRKGIGVEVLREVEPAGVVGEQAFGPRCLEQRPAGGVELGPGARPLDLVFWIVGGDDEVVVGAGVNPRLFAGEDADFCECRS